MRMLTEKSEEIQYIESEDGERLGFSLVPGREPAVVFLGGFRSEMCGTKGTWLADWARRRGQALVRFDYFGHGSSSGDFVRGTISRWRQDAGTVIDRLTTGPVVLVGSSMGGWIMSLVGRDLGDRLHAMVGIAVAPDFTEDLLWHQFTESEIERLRGGGVLFLDSPYDPEPTPLSMALFEDGRRNLVMRQPLEIHCPVRLLHGMVDREVPWETSLRYSRTLRSGDVRITLIKNGDHRLSDETNLALLGRILDELLEA
jgi:pimeloyl-ACP methyl ester carboxylesterase